MSDMQMSDAGDLDLEQECTSPLVQECEIYGGKQLSDDELLHLVVQAMDEVRPQLKEDSVLRLEESINTIMCHMKHFREVENQKQIVSLMLQNPEQSHEINIPFEVPALQDLVRELEKDLVSHGRIISHMRTEREKSAIACRMITSQQARECAGLRKKLKQAEEDVSSQRKELLILEQKLQSCTLELTIATNSVSEARNRERVSMRRLSAGVEREKQERKKLSNKYSKDTIGMKRDIDQLMVELQAERAERSKDVKDWETVVEDLTSELRHLKEANTQLNLELVEEKRFKDSANDRLHELTTELQNTQRELSQAHDIFQNVKTERMRCDGEDVPIRKQTSPVKSVLISRQVGTGDNNNSAGAVVYSADSSATRPEPRNDVHNCAGSDYKSGLLSDPTMVKELGVIKSDSDHYTATSEMLNEELQHMEDMEIMHAKLKHMESRLHCLSDENEVLRSALADVDQNHVIEAGRSTVDSTCDKSPATFSSIECETNNIKIRELDEIAQWWAKLYEENVAVAESAAVEQEEAMLKLQEKLEQAEMALFEKNESDAVELVQLRKQLSDLETILRQQQILVENEKNRSKRIKAVTSQKLMWCEENMKTLQQELQKANERNGTDMNKAADLGNSYEVGTAKHNDGAPSEMIMTTGAVIDNSKNPSAEKDIHANSVPSLFAELCSSITEVIGGEKEFLDLKAQEFSEVTAKFNYLFAELKYAKTLAKNSQGEKAEAFRLLSDKEKVVARQAEQISQLQIVEEKSNHLREELKYATTIANVLREEKAKALCLLSDKEKIVDSQVEQMNQLKIELSNVYAEVAKVRESNEVESYKRTEEIALVRKAAESAWRNPGDRHDKSIQCEKFAEEPDSSNDNNDCSYFVLPADLKPLREVYENKYDAVTSANERLKVELDTVRRECSNLRACSVKLTEDLTKALADKSSCSVLQSRNEALTRQLSSMPASLTIAHAEKRVAEAKMRQVEVEFRSRSDEERNKTAQIQFELNAFMRREEIERRTLLEKNHTQAQTIHQLTKHVKQLQTRLAVGCGETQVSDCLGVSGTGGITMPLPWPLSDSLNKTFSEGNDHTNGSELNNPIEDLIIDIKEKSLAQDKTFLGNYSLLMQGKDDHPFTAIKNKPH